MDITINGILLGLLALAIGLAFCFYGFRVFLVLLPIWGFFAGFLLGANAMTALFGDAFLATATGWVVGFLLGLLFAVLSYLYYWIAVILLGGALGYQLTLGVLQWISPDFDGFIAFILALIVGAIFAVGFFLLHMPAVLVIVATAIGWRGSRGGRRHRGPGTGQGDGPREWHLGRLPDGRPGHHLAHRGHRPGLRGSHLPDPHGGDPLGRHHRGAVHEPGRQPGRTLGHGSRLIEG